MLVEREHFLGKPPPHLDLGDELVITSDVQQGGTLANSDVVRGAFPGPAAHRNRDLGIPDVVGDPDSDKPSA